MTLALFLEEIGTKYVLVEFLERKTFFKEIGITGILWNFQSTTKGFCTGSRQQFLIWAKPETGTALGAIYLTRSNLP